jgi:hypothetical protein
MDSRARSQSDDQSLKHGEHTYELSFEVQGQPARFIVRALDVNQARDRLKAGLEQFRKGGDDSIGMYNCSPGDGLCLYSVRKWNESITGPVGVGQPWVSFASMDQLVAQAWFRRWEPHPVEFISW